MPKGFTEHEKQLIRKRLLEQGYKLFSAFGLKKTTIEELAEAAGVSKGAFYLFFASKEALYMDVVEELAEPRYRQEVLAAVDLPGPSPRARLLAVLRLAFSLFRTIPMLQFLTVGDYDLLYRRIPAETLQEHLASDREFFSELFARCQEAGFPIRARYEEVSALLYAIFLTVVHEDDLGPNSLGGSVDLLLELVAAFCLGEVVLQSADPISPTP